MILTPGAAGYLAAIEWKLDALIEVQRAAMERKLDALIEVQRATIQRLSKAPDKMSEMEVTINNPPGLCTELKAPTTLPPVGKLGASSPTEKEPKWEPHDPKEASRSSWGNPHDSETDSTYKLCLARNAARPFGEHSSKELDAHPRHHLHIHGVAGSAYRARKAFARDPGQDRPAKRKHGAEPFKEDGAPLRGALFRSRKENRLGVGPTNSQSDLFLPWVFGPCSGNASNWENWRLRHPGKISELVKSKVGLRPPDRAHREQLRNF